jgi:hypothetical protein
MIFTNDYIKNSNPPPVADPNKPAPFFKPAIQRQNDKQQEPNKAWTPDLLNILVFDDSNQGNCFGSAGIGENLRLSKCMKWPSCVSIHIPLRIEFYVDRANAPHPQPFQPGPVSVDITFTPSGKTPKPLHHLTDAAPAYKGPNLVLEPAFGKVFPIDIDTDGTLNVTASLHDEGSGKDIVYRDSARFVVLCS